jgi:hypothetical protein
VTENAGECKVLSGGRNGPLTLRAADAHLQVVLATGEAVPLVARLGPWWVSRIYD